MKKIVLYISLFLILLLVIGFVYLSNINNFKRDGSFQISKNTAPIKVNRDVNGIPYIIAENKADVIRGQGFVAAQDRLFQIEFYRALIKGELASIVGASMLQSDIKMRVLNLPQNATKSYVHLNEDTKNFLKWYCEGFNEYLEVGKEEYPFELSLLKMTPAPITPVEVVMIIHFIGLNHGKNMEDEVLSLNLAARTDDAKELTPYNVNPDRTKALPFQTDSLFIEFSEKLSMNLPSMPPTLLPEPKFGSNNWAIAESKSASGKVIVCNDPHLDARLLPGIFHPVGLVCPEFRGIGVAIPGIPGLVIGRNEHVAFGVTNAYGDSQDLIIEEVEGDYYVNKGNKVPFEKRKEVITVKDSTNVEIEIRSTVRGPIVSDFKAFGIMTNDIVSLHWSQSQSQSKSLGIERFLDAKNVFEFRDALLDIDNMFFNFVMGDVEGNIAHQATGLIPKRVNHQGQAPQSYTQTSNWDGFIPKDELPHMINPARNWVGTANHDTRPDDYSYYYSSHFSPKYRYARVKEVLEQDHQFDANDLWLLILDTKNKQAEQLTPLLVAALNTNEQTNDIASILKKWNHNDDINEVGATIYNVLYDRLVSLILNDELPDDIEESFWKNNYYWNQRIDHFMVSDHRFIDNNTTPEKETLNQLIVEAGIMTKEYLTERLGANQKKWTWGKIHTVKFASPIRQKGFGSTLVGSKKMQKAGSNQTINRGGYPKMKNTDFETGWFSTFRMVADLNDQEKFMGAFSGGNAARIFHPYYKSQLETWKNNEWIPYWISKEKILEHSKYELILE